MYWCTLSNALRPQENSVPTRTRMQLQDKRDLLTALSLGPRIVPDTYEVLNNYFMNEKLSSC